MNQESERVRSGEEMALLNHLLWEKHIQHPPCHWTKERGQIGDGPFVVSGTKYVGKYDAQLSVTILIPDR